MTVKIRKYKDNDINYVVKIWNEVVEEGVAFPQTELLTKESGQDFFAEQSYVGVAYNSENSEILGLYILHPNNIGRCGHICNASFAVCSNFRGNKIGEKLVLDCIKTAKELDFSILQFNAVVENNIVALKLYEKLGFVKLGIIPNGFLLKSGKYENIIPHYIEL